MKMTKLVILIVMIALALFLILPNLSWAADDGAALHFVGDRLLKAVCSRPNAM